VPVEAGVVASALASVQEHLIVAVPGGWVRRENGFVSGVTGVALPTLNGVWPEQIELGEGVVSPVLDEVARSGVPYCLQLRPGAPQQLAALAASRGMARADPIPLMVLDTSDGLEAAKNVDGLRIRRLEPDEAVLHARIAARGFETPVEPFVQLMTPELLRRPGTRCYLGEIDGEAVTTSVGVTLGGSVGIFNVATPRQHRGRGFGAAVTARAVADGLTDGAQWSFLQSSMAGYGVYRRMGYTEVERWDCWVSSL
jgi:predicted GNAT family acetyltransferase